MMAKKSLKDRLIEYVAPEYTRPSDEWRQNNQTHWTYPFGHVGGGNMKNFEYSASINLLETANQRVATLFSKIDLQYFKDYEKINDDLTDVLKLRPNPRQTPTEFWYTFFYQMMKYNHGIAYPEYGDNGAIKYLWVLDLNGQNICIVKEKNGVEYLKVVIGGDIALIPYSDVIHIRNHPETIFTCEQYTFKQNDIPRIVDENLSAMLTELRSNYDIKGIFKIGGSPSSTMSGVGANVQLSENVKQDKADDIAERVRHKLLVLDSGEEFTPITTEFLKSSIEDMQSLIEFYYSMLGIPSSIISSTWTYEEYSAFYESFLSPRVQSLEYELNYKLLTKTARTQGKEINIVVSRMSGMSYKDLTDFLLNSRYQGLFSANMVYKEIGYAPVKGGDEIIGNLNMSKDLDANTSTSQTDTLKGGEENE